MRTARFACLMRKRPLRVQLLMTRPAHADKLSLLSVPYTQCQVWPILQVLHVVDDDRPSMPPFRLAKLAFVMVKLEDLRPHPLPCGLVVPDVLPALGNQIIKVCKLASHLIALPAISIQRLDLYIGLAASQPCHHLPFSRGRGNKHYPTIDFWYRPALMRTVAAYTGSSPVSCGFLRLSAGLSVAGHSDHAFLPGTMTTGSAASRSCPICGI